MGHEAHERRTDALRDTMAPIEVRIRALDLAMWQRATDTAIRAGLDHRGRNVWHNAMIGRDTGSPWREVDYSLLREAIHIDDRRMELAQLRNRIWRAMFGRVFPGVLT